MWVFDLIEAVYAPLTRGSRESDANTNPHEEPPSTEESSTEIEAEERKEGGNSVFRMKRLFSIAKSGGLEKALAEAEEISQNCLPISMLVYLSEAFTAPEKLPEYLAFVSHLTDANDPIIKIAEELRIRDEKTFLALESKRADYQIIRAIMSQAVEIYNNCMIKKEVAHMGDISNLPASLDNKNSQRTVVTERKAEIDYAATSKRIDKLKEFYESLRLKREMAREERKRKGDSTEDGLINEQRIVDNVIKALTGYQTAYEWIYSIKHPETKDKNS